MIPAVIKPMTPSAMPAATMYPRIPSPFHLLIAPELLAAIAVIPHNPKETPRITAEKVAIFAASDERLRSIDNSLNTIFHRLALFILLTARLSDRKEDTKKKCAY